MVGTDHAAGKGIMPRAFEHIFSFVTITAQKKYLVRVSFLEIYNEQIRDLLSRTPKEKLELKDHPDGGVYVKGLSTIVVKGVDEMLQAMFYRSHSIFTVTIESCGTVTEEDQHIRVGRLNMVDLAGSERQAKTGATGELLREATKINLSLSALGNVISALVGSRASFIPYRDSKLTRLLQNSLGGNTKTVIIASIGPADYNYDETLSTLRYAHRAKNIRNKPRINEDPKDAMIKAFQDEIAKLKAELAHAASLPRETESIVDLQKRVVVEAVKPVEITIEKEVLVEKTVETVVPSGPDLKRLEELKMAVERERQLLHQRFEEERKRVEEAKNIAEEEKKILADELNMREKEQEVQRQYQLEMKSKIMMMEEKIVQGSQAMQQALKQEQELRKTQLQLKHQRETELKIRRDLEQQQMERLMLEKKFNSREEEVATLTSRLDELWRSFNMASVEIEDLQCEFQMEREDLLNTIRELSKEAKLQDLIIQNFIPAKEAETIMNHAFWDEDAREWCIRSLELAGNNV